MSSEELSRWAAYEKVSGPLGKQYSDITLASLHEQGQLTNYLLGAIFASWTEGTNPIPPPENYKLPSQVFSDDAPTTADSSEQQPEGHVSWEALAAEMQRDGAITPK